MAPLGSSEAAQTRFTGGFCSSSQSMAPSPMSGLGFEPRTHPQQFAPSSASPDDPAFRIRQQVRQLYFQQQQAALQNGGNCVHDTPASLDVPLASSDTGMVEDLPKEDRNIEQAIQNFVQENLSAAPGLMRYHSAPSSMLASLTGMGDAILNQGAILHQCAPLSQFLSDSALPLQAKGAYKHISASHSLANDHGDGGAAGTRLKQNIRCDATGVSHNNGLISSCVPASYQPVSVTNVGEQNFTGIGADLKGKDVMLLASDGPVESSRKAHEVPSSHPPRGSLLPKNPPSENGNGMARGVPMTRTSLLRQSSSPAGLLYQLNDNNETHMLGSSSGNSSEEGSYGNYTWDEAGNMIVGSPNASHAARKRIRDLEEKYFPGSTLKGEAAGEHGVLGNYFGLQAATSPENVYFPDKFSPDSVLCRARAKRGCATHPRSIAERNRRTKISERMRRLQELVPNMDKQTNTAEMLDEAVEYVKLLQRQVQELTKDRAKCKCSCGEQKETS